ncbi:SRPBCC family protein [Kribbella sp. NPDC051936]|uniref:SRPBCC family protein n=1 Tax=Kribbella sp. NPDC051936 TaxID=3154946 RepID=UPI003448B71E
MPEAEHTVRIRRPVGVVFAYFADGENDPQWRPLVKEIVRNGPIGPGVTYRQRIAGPGGRAIPSDYRVTAFEPDSHLAFEVIAGPVRPVGDYRFSPMADGTEVTFKISAGLSGLKKLLLTKPVQQSMNTEVAALDRAKEILEQQG